MRVDYFHTGTATQEFFSLDRVVIEPAPWPGNPSKALDDTNLGKYQFEVKDGAGKKLYSRGFASIYGEWEVTNEAKTGYQTFSESFRFPEPSSKVTVTLRKRGPDNGWIDIWNVDVDPKSIFVSTAAPPSPGPLIPLLRNGDPAEKVDFLILGDGYTAAERGKFLRDARKLVRILFSYSPFKERKRDFNVWGLVPPAAQSGISRPSTGVHRRSPVGATYDAFGAERYILTFDNRALRDIASFAPYEFIEILTNSKTYGGGGIYNLYSTVAADSLWAPYLFVHEFGHHFAGLADEYYTSDPVYAPSSERPEPWEVNATALKDPAQLKWKHLVAEGTPVPTPWAKKEFEAQSYAIQEKRRAIRAANRPESEMDALFVHQKISEQRMLRKEPHFGKVGAFEGANYEQQGYFRPQVDCVMFSRNDVPFCGVCQEGITRVIDLYAPRLPRK